MCKIFNKYIIPSSGGENTECINAHTVYIYITIYYYNITRCTRGVRKVFCRARMRSSNGARMNKSPFTTDKTEWFTYNTQDVRGATGDVYYNFYCDFYRHYTISTLDQAKSCTQIYLQKSQVA